MQVGVSQKYGSSNRAVPRENKRTAELEDENEVELRVIHRETQEHGDLSRFEREKNARHHEHPVMTEATTSEHVSKKIGRGKRRRGHRLTFSSQRA